MKIDHLSELGQDPNTESRKQHELQVQMEIEPSKKKPQIHEDRFVNQQFQTQNEPDAKQHFQKTEFLNEESSFGLEELESENWQRHQDSSDFEQNDDADDIEAELEKLAAKFGRNKQGDELLGHAGKNSSHPNSSFDLKINPQQKLHNFVDFKLVSIHPAIKSQLAFMVESLKSDISTLKKMLKKF